MQSVTICTKLGLNDLASDTQHPCAGWGQKTVSKNLFICLSCEFPFLTVHRTLHHLQCLWESDGDSSHCWWLSSASLLEQGHSLHCMVSKGGHHLPWGFGAVQYPICSTQLPNIRCSRGLSALLMGSSTLQHIAALTLPCMGLQQMPRPGLAPSPSGTRGWGLWYRLSGWRVLGENTTMLQSLLD